MSPIDKRLERIISFKKISGLSDGEKVILGGNFSHAVFLCPDFVTAGKYKRGLEALGKSCQIITSSREGKDGQDKNILPFISSVTQFLSGQCSALIVLPCSALIKFDIEKFLNPLKLSKGKQYNIENLTSTFVSMGYERVDLVSIAGQFALRGDILDIFPTNSENPVRIEFFDDLIEKISYFDIQTMKNHGQLEFFSFFPCILPYGEDDIFSLGGYRIIDQPKRVSDEFELLLKSYQTLSNFDAEEFNTFDDYYSRADIIFDNSAMNDEVCYVNQTLPTRSYLTDFMALKSDLLSYLNMHFAVVLFAGNEKNKDRIFQFLRDNSIRYYDYELDAFETGKIFVSSVNFPYSFSFLKERIVAIGSDSIFKQNVTKFSKGKHSVFYLPKLNDYVVHSFHGIGKCVEIKRMKIGDYEKDYFVIEYKAGGTLYLPSEEANTISAYIGGEENPKLSSLGGAEFTRLKNKVKSSLKEMAISLTEVYRERQNSHGFSFKRDEFLEKQFADSFGYQETDDQLKAIADIDADMQSDKIMDRLICGDVGYGKTEVALRACFKCAYNGKQVCLLCPTTILSEQHYKTAKARLESFGINVEVLNRFKTPSEVKSILERLKNGKIDMIIGTHRLLGKDVVFHDLGLLVLDEEQRFGVEDKEKIKNSKRSVDVLSLSATPIPRTLNMSLSGIRDISIIETPPKERLPIQTYVAEQSDELIKDVLSRELARGGQAFVIYNRVEDIEEFSAYISRLVPNSKVGFAHGQMNEKLLERVIERMFDGEYNIIVSTTLIENGIDLPSANTMVIIDSDKLGLGQLYQIRGRIGRSDRLSYAYLTYVKDKILTPEAYKRLEAIKEFSQLGSGFKIAMRDLEIRGAGNIFGKEQHGHIAKVGYDMFVKLLDEAVGEIQGNKLGNEANVKLEVTLDAFISESYISSSDERIVFYTKISEIKSLQERDEVLSSLVDAFGAVPIEVENLCLLALLRNLAAAFGILKVQISPTKCALVLEKREDILDPRLAKVMNQFGGKLAFDSLAKLTFDKVMPVRDKVKTMVSLLIEAKNQ